MKLRLFILLLAGSMMASGAELYKDSRATPEQRTEDLLARMTLEEKVDQLAGRGIGASEFGDQNASWFGTATNDRLGIPNLVMGHGITGVRSGRDQNVKSTYMMAPIGMGASWDTELYARTSMAIAKEMMALGQDLNLGTTLNIIRHPQGGRNWESFSEDPYLTARLAVAHVKAMQANGIISGPKHFVANNQEHQRFNINNEVEERTLREIYLPAFKAAVVEGGALNIMGAYNRVNGSYMCENKWLLTDVLRKEWGFKGFVLSDFSYGVRSTIPTAMAGMNIEMHSPKFFGEKMLQAIKSGELDESVIDQLLREKLWVMFKMGIFDERVKPAASIVHCEEHQALALEVARKSPILLKNSEGMLPLDRTKIKRLAVIGPNAKRHNPKSYYFLQGGGSGRTYHFPDAVVDPLTGIQAQAGQADVRYAQGCQAPKRDQKEDLAEDAALIEEAVALAKESDTVILMVGLTGDLESEGRDRKHAFLPDNQPELVEKVLAANPNTVVVIFSGSYVDVSAWVDDAKALVFGFYNGEKMGQAMADVLFGHVCPGGKLPISYPKSTDQYPKGSIFKGGPYSKEKVSNVYSEGIFVGYRYFDTQETDLLFPFGFGLSYTSFEYSDLKVNKRDGEVAVSVTVKNTGSVVGDEIVQLYVHDEKSSIPRPVRELKGFDRISLKPGESKAVSFTLKRDAFSYWSPEKKAWYLEPGVFEIQMGASSRDIRMQKAISIESL